MRRSMHTREWLDKVGRKERSSCKVPILSPTSVRCCQRRREASRVAQSRAKSSASCCVETAGGAGIILIPKDGEKRAARYDPCSKAASVQMVGVRKGAGGKPAMRNGRRAKVKVSKREADMEEEGTCQYRRVDHLARY